MLRYSNIHIGGYKMNIFKKLFGKKKKYNTNYNLKPPTMCKNCSFLKIASNNMPYCMASECVRFKSIRVRDDESKG